MFLVNVEVLKIRKIFLLLLDSPATIPATCKKAYNSVRTKQSIVYDLYLNISTLMFS